MTRTAPAWAFGTASLVLDWADWSHRRVEAISLLDGESARRRVSVDLTVPAQVPWPLDSASVRSPSADSLVVPIAFLQKERLRSLDVVDASGASVPVLGRSENVELAAGFIEALLRAEGKWDEQRTSLQEEIRRVAGGPRAEATCVAAEVADALDLSGSLSGEYLDRLASTFILAVVVPGSMAGQRTLIKFSYHWEAGQFSGSQHRVRRGLWRLSAAVGLTSQRLETQVGDLGLAASYHFEIPVPKELRARSLRLEGVTGDGAQDRTPGSVGHALVGVDRRATDVTAVLVVDQRRAGIHGITLASSVLTALIFSATRPFVGVEASEAGLAASLLLAGPAVVLTFLVRPRESSVVSRLLDPLRALVLGLSAALFAAALALSIKLSGGPVRFFWDTSIAAASVVALLLSVGWACLTVRQTRKGQGNG